MQSIMGSRGNSGATNVKHERKIMLKAGLLECSKEGRVPPRKIRKTFTTTLLPKWLCPEAPDNCLIAKLSPWGDQNFKCHFNWKSFIPRSWEFSEEHTYLLFPCVWSLKTVLTDGKNNMFILPTKNWQTKGPLLFCPSWSGAYWLLQSL